MPKFGSAKAARRKARKTAGRIATRKKKEFTFRGMTLEELQKLDDAQVLEILPSRARRSLTRGMSHPQKIFWKHVDRGDEKIRTHMRDIVILPKLVGKTVSIYNGREFVDVIIQPEMIGHYLGEFALTRKPPKHTGPGVGATRSSKHMPLK